MASPRILVVEDDLGALQGIRVGLRKHGFDVAVAMDGHDALERALAPQTDLVVLDLMLPGLSGFQVLERLQGRTSVPIIVLSARTELEARLECFAHGAIDYVAKPFFIEELVARIRARLSMVAPRPRRTHELREGLVADLDARQVLRDGHDIGLTAHEFNVLAWLVERPKRAVSRDQLAAQVLGSDGPRAHRTVDSHVSRLRRKLAEDARFIETVWGIGYRYEPAP